MLGLRSLAASTSQLDRLLSDTNAKEPVLIIISPGVDPSEELRSLAKAHVGSNFHEVNKPYSNSVISEGVQKVKLQTDHVFQSFNNIHKLSLNVIHFDIYSSMPMSVANNFWASHGSNFKTLV